MGVVTIVAAAVCSAGLTLGEPEVFSDAGYETDRAAAVEQDRLHLVYATASWCPPCQRMKKTTWVDESVESWVEQHGIVTALDVDEFPQIARDLGVELLPTMVIFKNGTELGGIAGYTDAIELLAWLEEERNRAIVQLGGGEDANSVDFVVWEGAAGNQGWNEVPLPFDSIEESALFDRFDAANRMFYDRENLRDAGFAYAWLWEHMRTTDRLYFRDKRKEMPEPMAQLAVMYGDVRNKYKSLRDMDAEALRGNDRSWERLEGWIMLNGVIEDYDATFTWIERIKDRPGADVSFGTMRYLIEDQAHATKRWDVLVTAFPDAVAMLRGTINTANDFLDHGFIQEEGWMPFVLGGLQTPTIVALYTEDDGQLEAELISLLIEELGDNGEWRTHFIETAREVGKLRAEHTAWIAEYNLNQRFPSFSDNEIKPEF